MKFGYARVSKKDQNLENQIKKLASIGCEEIFYEKISGAKDDRPQLKIMLNKLRKGDVVYVVKLDRLGRRMLKLIELINDFKKKGIELISLENNIDTTNSIGMLLFNICAAFSEMERELIKERIIAGIDNSKKNGVRGGRPKSITNKKRSKLLSLIRSKNMSIRDICNTIQISKSTYYREINNNLFDR